MKLFEQSLRLSLSLGVRHPPPHPVPYPLPRIRDLQWVRRSPTRAPFINKRPLDPGAGVVRRFNRYHEQAVSFLRSRQGFLPFVSTFALPERLRIECPVTMGTNAALRSVYGVALAVHLLDPLNSGGRIRFQSPSKVRRRCVYNKANWTRTVQV